MEEREREKGIQHLKLLDFVGFSIVNIKKYFSFHIESRVNRVEKNTREGSRRVSREKKGAFDC